MARPAASPIPRIRHKTAPVSSCTPKPPGMTAALAIVACVSDSTTSASRHEQWSPIRTRNSHTSQAPTSHATM